MLWHRQAIFEPKGDKLSSSAACRIRIWKSHDTYSPADWMPTHKPTELSRIKLKTWTQQPVPMMSEHSAHLTSLPFGFRTWLWRYTCLLLCVYICVTRPKWVTLPEATPYLILKDVVFRHISVNESLCLIVWKTITVWDLMNGYLMNDGKWNKKRIIRYIHTIWDFVAILYLIRIIWSICQKQNVS